MSGILRRQLLVDTSKGYFIAHDYALVTTELGTAVEPGPHMQRFNLNTGQLTGYEPEDQIARIDNFIDVSLGKERSIFADDNGTVLQGGVQAPRVGY